MPSQAQVEKIYEEEMKIGRGLRGYQKVLFIELSLFEIMESF